METLIEAPEHAHVCIVTDGTFSVWLTKELEKAKLHGPSSSTDRKNRIVIPEGYDGLMVVHASDVHIEVESIVVHNPREIRHGKRQVVDVVDPAGDDPMKQMHALMVQSLGEIERRYADKIGVKADEDDPNDFDVPNPDVAPWETALTGYEVMEDDVPDEVISWAEYIASKQSADAEPPETAPEPASDPPEGEIAEESTDPPANSASSS